MINGRIHYKWSFSIAMLNYQRVYTVIHINDFLRKPGEVLLGRDSREITFSAFLRVQPYQSMRWFEFDCSIMFDQARFFSPSRAVPAVTFYRDSSAQCPNCQAVWLLLAARICKLGTPRILLSPQAEVGLEHLFSIWEAPKGWSCSDLQSEIQPTLSPWWAIRIAWKCDTAFEEVKDIDYLVVKEDLRAYGEKSPSFLEKVSWRTSCTMLWFNLAFSLECLNKQNWACVQQKRWHTRWKTGFGHSWPTKTANNLYVAEGIPHFNPF